MAGSKSTCCSVRIFKYIFHIFNIVFLISGLGLLAVGVWSIFWRYHLVQVQVTHVYAFIVYTVLVIGVLITIVNIIGYIGVWKENRCTILYYAFFLLVILLIEIAIGLISSLYRHEVHKEMIWGLNTTFIENYHVHEKHTKAIDYIQKRLRCCGALRFEDWRVSRWYSLNKNRTAIIPDLCKQKYEVAAVVPMSCCRTPSVHCGCSDHPSNIYYNGCIHRLRDEIRLHLTTVEWVSFFIAGLQFFGIVLSCILCIKVKNNY